MKCWYLRGYWRLKVKIVQLVIVVLECVRINFLNFSSVQMSVLETYSPERLLSSTTEAKSLLKIAYRQCKQTPWHCITHRGLQVATLLQKLTSQPWSSGTPCPACFRYFPAPTHLNKVNGRYYASAEIDKDISIWIRCVGAGKHLKHAEQVGPGLRTTARFLGRTDVNIADVGTFFLNVAAPTLTGMRASLVSEQSRSNSYN